MRRRRRCAACGIAGLIAGLSVPAVAVAATIPVTTTDDAVSADAVCSLREALNAANSDTGSNGCPAGSGADEITLRAGRYRLTLPGSSDADLNAGGDLDVTSAVTFRGVGAGATTLDGNLTDRVLDVRAGGVVTVRDLTITRGHAPDGAAGTGELPSGGLGVSGGTGGAGAAGGAIRSAGAVTVVSSTIVANVAGDGGDGGGAHAFGGILGSGGGDAVSGSGGPGGAGGGISASGPLTVIDSRLVDNTAGSGGAGGEAVAGGGAVAVAPGPGGVGGSAFNGGGAGGGRGGAIAATAALVISRTTISGNRAGAGGSGANTVGGAGGKSMGAGPGGAGGTVAGLFNGAGGPGGGVLSSGGLTMIDSTVTGNVAGNGGNGGASTGGAGGAPGGGTGASGAGAMASGGFGGTGGQGGGMALLGPSSLERVTVAGNLAGNGGAGGAATGGGTASGKGGNGGDASQGGGLEIFSATTLTNVTIDANRTGSGGPGGAGSTNGGNGGRGGTGGAIQSFTPDLAIAGATITGNTFGSPGAGAVGALGGPTGIPGQGGALSQTTGTIAMRESIVSANQAPSCSVPTITGANNLHLALDSGCPGLAADPALGPLADNGGSTRTRAPAPDSPALDRFACSGVDQRGVLRPFGALCDIGAYERAAPLVGLVTAGAVTATTATLAVPVNPDGRATSVTFDFGPTIAYGKTTAPVSLAAGVASQVASAAIAGLTLDTTYHVRARATNADGSAIGADRTFTTAKQVNQAPVVSKLAAVPSTFAVARGRTAISAATGRTKTVPRGTSLRFTLSEAATVRLAFSRPTVGRRVVTKGKVSCVATRILPKRRAQRCTRFVAAGSLTRRGRKAGRNAVAFTGRLGSRALALGTYRVTVTATDGAGKRSRAVAAAFRVVKPTS